MYHEILEARKRIRGHVYKTPLIRLNHVSNEIGAEVYAKLENLQLTNSFKIRGVMNKVLSLSEEELKNGMVTASSGNHGKAVAYAAKTLGIPATVVLPKDAPIKKVEMIGALGADIIFSTIEERFENARLLAEERKALFIHSHDDLDVCRGQGTIGCEIVEELRPDKVIIPTSGGGLLGGIASFIKGYDKHIKVVGCEPENVPKFSANLNNDVPVAVASGETIAEALRSVSPGKKVFDIVRKNTDEIASVSDAAIIRALDLLYNYEKLVVEPSSAITLAGIIEGKIGCVEGEKIVLVLSGGNIDASKIEELIFNA